MASVIISQLNKNEHSRFLLSSQTCSHCGNRITALPISVKYKIGRTTKYEFYHLPCYILKRPVGFTTNAEGLNNLFEKGV